MVRGVSDTNVWCRLLETRGLDSTAVVSLERQGLGASTGLAFLGVPGDGREMLSFLGIEGDSPGLWWRASFGLGATGGLGMPEFIIASLLSSGLSLLIDHCSRNKPFMSRQAQHAVASEQLICQKAPFSLLLFEQHLRSCSKQVVLTGAAPAAAAGCDLSLGASDWFPYSIH